MREALDAAASAREDAPADGMAAASGRAADAGVGTASEAGTPQEEGRPPPPPPIAARVRLGPARLDELLAEDEEEGRHGAVRLGPARLERLLVEDASRRDSPTSRRDSRSPTKAVSFRLTADGADGSGSGNDGGGGGEERDARRRRWLSQEAPPTTPTAARLSAPASPNAGSRPSPGAGASSGRSASCRKARRSFRDAVTPVAPRASRLSSFRPPSLRRLASRERAAPPAPEPHAASSPAAPAPASPPVAPVACRSKKRLLAGLAAPHRGTLPPLARGEERPPAWAAVAPAAAPPPAVLQARLNRVRSSLRRSMAVPTAAPAASSDTIQERIPRTAALRGTDARRRDDAPAPAKGAITSI